MESPSALSFLAWLFSPALRWWWAAISGSASVAALFLAPSTGVVLSPGWLGGLILGGSLLLFLTVSVVARGWSLFANTSCPITVLSANKTKNDYNAKILFVLSGRVDGADRAVLEIRRTSEQEELPFAVVRVVERTESGNLMAIPLYVSPTALKDFNAHAFGVADMRVRSLLTYDRFVESRNEPL